MLAQLVYHLHELAQNATACHRISHNLSSPSYSPGMVASRPQSVDGLFCQTYITLVWFACKSHHTLNVLRRYADYS